MYPYLKMLVVYLLICGSCPLPASKADEEEWELVPKDEDEHEPGSDETEDISDEIDSMLREMYYKLVSCTPKTKDDEGNVEMVATIFAGIVGLVQHHRIDKARAEGFSMCFGDREEFPVAEMIFDQQARELKRSIEVLVAQVDQVCSGK